MANSLQLTVKTDAPGIAIDPRLVGIFFEDINFGADGGLSAELVKNASFEFADPLLGWRKIELPGAVGGIGYPSDDPPFPNNPRYARLTIEKPGEGFGLQNDGFRGMPFRSRAMYRFSAMIRRRAGAIENLRVELLGAAGAVLASATIPAAATAWTRVEAVLESAETFPNGSLRILAREAGVLDIEAVSLMPVDTWKGRANGMRPDLVQMLADLRPGFMRFPGGCIVEGRTLENRYRWKETLGPVENRRVQYNRWNVEFSGSGRGAADYYQTVRVGYFEYFQLCEDIGAEPLPILNCGMACQFNCGELVPLDQMGPYVQDALDLVEFANGPATSRWGRVRAEMGHPTPFNLKMIGIGNEQWGEQYYPRYAAVANALRARYPEIQLVFSAGPGPEDDKFRAAWAAVPGLAVDIVDEHCYAPPEWFLDNADRYDRRDRKGPKVFMGEYAAHPASKKNDLSAAIAEAAYLAGMERNADVVVMSAYAPLFAHVDAWQWRPDLIWFDNLRAAPTPSYFVQQLFSGHRTDVSLPFKLSGAPVAANGKPRVFASVGRSGAELIIKLVNATDTKQSVCLQIGGKHSATARATLLTAASQDAENTLDAPRHVAPVEFACGADAVTLPPWSLAILRVQFL